ncbi:unnamed protein product [Thlaspi arvense]|uniref:F-box domain-containing protein n=1 Tax=Thlaspi arvense TaxID=13288 RepID=A0AAU9SE08_THLAR|nr:unnamed protein product [Thlaspi arvense]
MEKEKRRKMYFLTEDTWTMVLVRVPLKRITTSKLVCKQWRSIVESTLFRELFLSHHQNSHSSWSLILGKHSPKEVLAHYGCKIWGLSRSLGSYVSSFVTSKFDTNNEKPRVLAYTDVGLILICVTSIPWNRTYYVANPVSLQCVKIPPLPKSLRPFTQEGRFSDAGLVTRTENGVVLGYKVVLIQTLIVYEYLFTFIVNSSETRLWSSNHLRYSIPLSRLNFQDPICLNKSLHWFGLNLGKEVVVSIDFYGPDRQYRVITFPDSDKRKPNFKRSCTTSQGNLMYMNIVSEDDGGGVVEHKLSVWRLKNREWELVSEISPSFIETGLDYFPFLVNPFDSDTVYAWSEMYESLASINLSNGESRVHSELERTGNGQALSSVGCKRKKRDTIRFLSSVSHLSMFALPRWLYRIPGNSEVRKPNTFWLLSNVSA